MRKGFSRMLCFALCAVMIFALAACNKSGTTASSSGGSPVTLTFWHIWGSGDPTSTAVTKVINDFNALDNNITVNVETFENDKYKDKIRIDIPGGTGPDVFSSWGGGESRPYVDAGKVLVLDSYLNDGTKDRMLGGALANTTYDGKVYGLTFGLAASGFYCNNRLFTENSAAIPKTWDDLTAAVGKFKAAGITPISTSIQEKWVVSMLFEGLALKTTGAEAIMKALTQGGDAFGDPGFLLAAQKILELVDMGAINADANAISRNDAEVPIKAGDIPMYYMGSWAAGMLVEDDCVDKGNFTYIPFPTVPNTNGKATEFNGGAADCIMVNADSKNPDAAAQFAKYFCENVSREGYLNGSYMPTWKIGSVDESGINPIMVSIKEATASATNFVLWWDTFLGPDLAAIYQDALVELLNGAITPEAFVEKLKTIKPV